MSIYNLVTLSNYNRKKLAQECISLDDVYDKCKECGRPTLLHKEEVYMREVEEGFEVMPKTGEI